VSLHHTVRWVKEQYLSDKKPTSRSSGSRSGGGISRAPCPSGSWAASALTPDAICVHCAVRQRYPQVIITLVGLWSSSGYRQVRALDCMISGLARRLGHRALGPSQRQEPGREQSPLPAALWPVEQSSEGWRSTSDRAVHRPPTIWIKYTSRSTATAAHRLVGGLEHQFPDTRRRRHHDSS
jgi:hypothetical protein